MSRSLCAGLLAAVLALNACSSESSGSETTEDDARGSQRDAMLAFYQCLRDGGLDVEDPGHGGAIQLPPIDRDDPAIMATIDECRDASGLAAAGGGPMRFGNMGDNLADTSALIAFVDCVREHGIEMADPAADGRLSLPANVDPNSSAFQTAVRECSSHLAGGGILMGEPGGGGGAVRGGQP